MHAAGLFGRCERHLGKIRVLQPVTRVASQKWAKAYLSILYRNEPMQVCHLEAEPKVRRQKVSLDMKPIT